MKNRSFRRWLTLVLVLAMLLGILPAVAAADASLSDYAPAGTTNLAVGATLTVSNGTHNAMGQENSYEMPSEHWSKDFVHDGVLDGQGFSTNPYDSEPDASVQVVLTFDLGRRCSVSKFGVFARAGAIFPTDYQIETSLLAVERCGRADRRAQRPGRTVFLRAGQRCGGALCAAECNKALCAGFHWRRGQRRQAGAAAGVCHLGHGRAGIGRR